MPVRLMYHKSPKTLYVVWLGRFGEDWGHVKLACEPMPMPLMYHWNVSHTLW